MISWDDIRRAIGHPSSVLPRLPGEPPSNWQARVVVHLLEAAEAEATDGENDGGMLGQIVGIIELHSEMVEEEYVRPLADVIHATTVRPAIRRLTRQRDHLRECVDQAEAERDQLKAAVHRVRRLCDLTLDVSIRVDARHQAIDTLAALNQPKEST